MNNSILKITLGALLAAFTLNANAQKAYNEGVATYSLSTAAGASEAKVYFTADSSATVTLQGPATIRVVSNTKGTYAAIAVDVPVASIKKVAVLTPDEVEQTLGEIPKMTFTPSTETKTINGFNCKKVSAKDAKSGSNITVWVTNDITAPANSVTKSFANAGGVPVQFSTTQQGQEVSVELKSIVAQKVPAGTFGIPAGFDKISLEDLKSLGGR